MTEEFRQRIKEMYDLAIRARRQIDEDLSKIEQSFDVAEDWSTPPPKDLGQITLDPDGQIYVKLWV